MRIYLDSAQVIDLIEQVAPFAAKVLARIGVPGTVLVSSHLTCMECSILPLRNGDAALLLNFNAFFSTQVAEMIPFTESVFRTAAIIRAQTSIKTPDALHLAAAMEAKCDIFLTNDIRLKTFVGITVEVVS